MRIILVIFFVLLIGCKEKDLKIQKEAFADPALYECVLESKKLVGTIYNEETQSVSQKFEHLDCKKNIKSFEGIQQLKDLKKLFIVNSKAADLTPLGSLLKLEKLWLHHSAIQDISPLRDLTQLKHLSLEYNNITDISPLSSLNKLERLKLTNNKVKDLSSLSELSNLKVLGLVDNKIIDVSPLSDLSGLVELNLNRIEVTGSNPIINAKPLLALKNINKLFLNMDTIDCADRELLKEAFNNNQLNGMTGNGCPTKVLCKAMEKMEEQFGDKVRYDFDECTITFLTQEEMLKLGKSTKIQEIN